MTWWRDGLAPALAYGLAPAMRCSSATVRRITAGESPKSSASRCSIAVPTAASLLELVEKRTFPVWMYVVTPV